MSNGFTTKILAKLHCSMRDYNDRFIWTLFRGFQTLLFQVFGDLTSGHIGLLAALMKTKDFRTYLDANARNVTSVWVNGCLH